MMTRSRRRKFVEDESTDQPTTGRPTDEVKQEGEQKGERKVSKRAKKIAATDRSTQPTTPTAGVSVGIGVMDVRGLMIQVISFLSDVDRTNFRLMNKFLNECAKAPQSWPPLRRFTPMAEIKHPMLDKVEQMVLSIVSLVPQGVPTGSKGGNFEVDETGKVVDEDIDFSKLLARSRDTLQRLEILGGVELSRKQIASLPTWAPNLKMLRIMDNVPTIDWLADAFTSTHDGDRQPSDRNEKEGEDYGGESKSVLGSLTSLWLERIADLRRLAITIQHLPQLENLTLNMDFGNVEYDITDEEKLSVCKWISKMKLKLLSLSTGLYHRSLLSSTSLQENMEYLGAGGASTQSLLPELQKFTKLKKLVSVVTGDITAEQIKQLSKLTQLTSYDFERTTGRVAKDWVVKIGSIPTVTEVSGLQIAVGQVTTIMANRGATEQKADGEEMDITISGGPHPSLRLKLS